MQLEPDPSKYDWICTNEGCPNFMQPVLVLKHQHDYPEHCVIRGKPKNVNK